MRRPRNRVDINLDGDISGQNQVGKKESQYILTNMFIGRPWAKEEAEG